MAMLPRRLWAEMTTRDFADSDTSGWIAVLPVAAIEQHGPHLPVYTDTCIAEGMVARAIELLPDDLPVTFLPAQAVGKSNEHISSPGTLTTTWETATKLWLDIGDSVQRAGVRKLIVMNSHGGNVPMVDIVARELRVRHDMLVVATAWSRFGHPEGVQTASEARYGIHGGDIETSVMLYLRPDLVRMDQARDFRSAQLDFIDEFQHLRAHGLVQFGWKAQDLNPHGTVGNASAATAEKGRAVVDFQAAAFVALCHDVHAFDPGAAVEAVATTRLDALRADLAGIALADDPATLKLKSRDFFWFSPILKPLLDDKRADLIALPRSKDEVVRIAAACARHRVPLTVRGGGTGNYGQAVPLAGGLVIDMAGLDRTARVTPGAGRFEAGARLLDIDRSLRDMAAASGNGRWELRFHPSTRKQATIGGFVAGGAAGCGSCTWGQISDPGAVIAAEVVTVEERPRVIALAGRDVLKVLHAYGVNGIITEVEVPLAPWQPWAERVVAFPSLAAAARFGFGLAAAEGIAKKEIGVFDAAIPPLLKRLAPLVPAGHAMAIVMVAEAQTTAFAELVADHGGIIVYQRSAVEGEDAAFDGKGAMLPLYEYTWNHTTLHALKVEPAITYLQIRFPAGGELALVERIEREFAGEILLHLEFQRRGGRVFVSSLPLLRYRSAARLAEVVAAVEAMGGAVSNPHTYVLDDAGWKRTDAPQAEFKTLADPLGLMNPGKLKAWPPR